MTQERIKILAIDPGTREMGVAFLEGKDLRYHAVITLKDRSSPHRNLEEGRAAVEHLLSDLKPDILVVEKTFIGHNRNAALLNVLMEEIKSLGKAHEISVFSYAPSTVRKHVCGNGRATKLEVAQVLVSHYPELKVYLKPNRKWKFKYHANMFDALALGVMVMQKTEPHFE